MPSALEKGAIVFVERKLIRSAVANGWRIYKRVDYCRLLGAIVMVAIPGLYKGIWYFHNFRRKFVDSSAVTCSLTKYQKLNWLVFTILVVLWTHLWIRCSHCPTDWNCRGKYRGRNGNYVGKPGELKFLFLPLEETLRSEKFGNSGGLFWKKNRFQWNNFANLIYRGSILKVFPDLVFR